MLFQNPISRKLAKFTKAIMNTLCSMCFVCTGEVVNLINDLLDVMRSFTSEHVLAEKFAKSILEVFASIYYSGIVNKLTPEQIIKILDACLQIGWRNVYYTSEQQIPFLIEYMLNKNVIWTGELNRQSEENLDAGSKIASQLTFPVGGSGRKIIDDMDSKLKTKGKIADPLNTYFSYQQEGHIVMHLSTENIVHFFIYLNKTAQTQVLPYFSKIASLETKNEQSSILQQTFILFDY